MEKIMFLVSPAPENFLLVLQKVWYDLSFLLVVYNWFVSKLIISIGVVFVIKNRRNEWQICRNLISMVIGLFRQERQILIHQVQRRILIAADNFF